ncbi:MAG TPA: B12-binding domain-containing radical SAM protein [Candidatus Coprousia avicola]|nr:B12-binding domain-containing radical SAM protein [Candidatus Coprousia avicola]
MRCFICIPGDDTQSGIYPPVGLAYINAVLRGAGHDVHCFNWCFRSDDELACALSEFNPQVALMGGTSYDLDAFRTFFRLAKAAVPGVVCIGGGAGFTSEPVVFSELTGADIAIVGEGERTTARVISILEQGRTELLQSLPGIVVRSEGRLRYTGDAKEIEDIDSIPFPDYTGFEMERYFENQRDRGFARYFNDLGGSPRAMVMFTSRSCPYACGFCCHTLGRRYRKRSLDAVFAELDLLMERYAINAVYFADELFVNDLERLAEFCRRIAPYGIRWAADCRVEAVSRPMLAMMKEAGCVALMLGLESYSDDVLQEMGKRISPSQIEAALDAVEEAKMCIEGHFIFGTPHETRGTFLESFRCWKRYRRIGVDILWLLLYPGTRYYCEACERGLIKDRARFIEDGMPHINITHMPQPEYEALARIGTLCLLDDSIWGRIARAEAGGGAGQAELECPLCGAKFTRSIGRRDAFRGIGRQKLEFECPACKRYSVYSFKGTAPAVTDLILRQIEAGQTTDGAQQSPLASFCRRNGIRRCAVLGYSRQQAAVVHALGEAGVDVCTREQIPAGADPRDAAHDAMDAWERMRSQAKACKADTVICAVGCAFEAVEDALADTLAEDGLSIFSAIDAVFDFPYHAERPEET